VTGTPGFRQIEIPGDVFADVELPVELFRPGIHRARSPLNKSRALRRPGRPSFRRGRGHLYRALETDSSRGSSSTSQPVSVLLGDLGPCLLGLFHRSESHHSTRIGSRSERPISGTVPNKAVEPTSTRSRDWRGVHLLSRTELFNWQVTPPPNRIAVSGPPRPVDPEAEPWPSSAGRVQRVSQPRRGSPRPPRSSTRQCRMQRHHRVES